MLLVLSAFLMAIFNQPDEAKNTELQALVTSSCLRCEELAAKADALSAIKAPMNQPSGIKEVIQRLLPAYGASGC
jgi:hypothetical protein